MTDLAHVTLAGNVFTVKPMTDGQLESLFRVQRSLSLAGDHSVAFYGRQIARMGALLDSLFATDEDRDRIDELYLTGQLTTRQLLAAVLAAYNQRADDNKAIEAPPKKPAVKAIKKAPAKKAPAKKAPAKRAPRAK